jgi:DNA-binding NarL/FixJ family response regulator
MNSALSTFSLQRTPRRDYKPRGVTSKGLSQRESEVAALAARGCSDRVIASTLGIAKGSIKTFMRHIFDKTGATSRRDLIDIAPALRTGLPTP